MNLEPTKAKMVAIVERFQQGRVEYDDALKEIERIKAHFRKRIDLLAVEGAERLPSRLRKQKTREGCADNVRLGLLKKLDDVTKIAMFSLSDAKASTASNFE